MASPPTFFADANAVYMTGTGGPFILADQNIEALLALFEDVGDRVRFNALYDAHLIAGGIARVTSMRAA